MNTSGRDGLRAAQVWTPAARCSKRAGLGARVARVHRWSWQQRAREDAVVRESGATHEEATSETNTYLTVVSGFEVAFS